MSTTVHIIALAVALIAIPGERPALASLAAASPAATPAGNPAATPAGNPAATPAGNPAGNPAATPAGNPAATPAGNPAGTSASVPGAAVAASPPRLPGGAAAASPPRLPGGIAAASPPRTVAQGSDDAVTPTGDPDSPTPRGAPSSDTPRSLERPADPIIITGNHLGPLVGTPLERIGCFRAVDSGLEPIPCQIDERTRNGQLVLPSGPDANPDDGDEHLSPQDELVFMVHDAGPRRVTPSWPAGFLRGVELEIAEPSGSGRAWVYLASFDRAAPRSPIDYVRYTPGTERVESSSYLLGYSSQAPIVFDTLVLKKAAGGSGVDSVDRMKIRLSARVWKTFRIEKTENDYTSVMMGYIDGPVRVLRRTKNRQILFWNIPSPSAIQDNYFYDTFFEFPVVVNLPFDLDAFLSEADLRISVDLKDNPARRFFNDRNSSPVMLDGTVSPDENALDHRPYAWSVMYGTRPADTAGWVNRLSLSTNTRIDPELYYSDDGRRPDPPEEHAGQVGNVGYQVRNLRGLKKGTHYLTSVLYSFPKYAPGLERLYLAVKDAPLKARVTRQFP